MIAVGRDLNTGMLLRIVKDKKNFFYAPSFDTLNSDGFIGSISKKACQDAGMNIYSVGCFFTYHNTFVSVY